jgi:GAF domain-containing protein
MRILHTIKTPLRDAQNQIYAVLGFARDVTEREQLLAHAEALYQAGAGLNLAQTHHAILDVFLQYTLLGQNADNVSLNYFDTPLSAAQTPRWIYTLARYSRLDQGATGNRHAASELPALFDLLEKNDATIITDVSTDPRLDEVTRRYYTGRFGAHSTIFIPLVIGGQWYGFINAIYGRPATFPEPDVRRLMILAGHAAVAVQAIQQLQATERRARREQTIREITEKMRGATNLHSLIKVTATELAQNLSAGAAVVELGLEPAGSHPPAPSSRREGAN